MSELTTDVVQTDSLPAEKRQFPLWHLPALDRDEAALEKAYQEEHQTGYDEGFRLGKQAGLKAAESEVRESSRQFMAIMNSVNTAFSKEDIRVSEQLAWLAASIAEAVIRAELSIRPEHMVEMLRRLVAQIPGESERVRLRLSPADADLVSNRLRSDGVEGSERWEISADGELDQGDCVLSTQYSVMDARIVKQVETIIHEILDESV